MPHPPHYEQLPSCLLARSGWGARGQEGREGGSGQRGGEQPSSTQDITHAVLGGWDQKGLLSFQIARRSWVFEEGLWAGSGVFRAQAAEGAAHLKGAPGWYCGVKQSLPLLRKPHGGSREPMRSARSGGLDSDT